MHTPRRILISRADGIGDVVLTLPVAAFLKKKYPDCAVLFLGNSYTKPVIDACCHVDQFVGWDSVCGLDKASQRKAFGDLNVDTILHVFPNKHVARLAKQAKIPLRIGTRSRFHHLLYCNRLVSLSRNNSLLHEAQLNLKLLAPLDIHESPTLDELHGSFGLTKIKQLPQELKNLIKPQMAAVILHPCSKGSAREWGLDRFSELVALLPVDLFQIFVTGSAREGQSMASFLVRHKARITDLTGKLSLEELISFIGHCDALVAASTGPLHIAAALDKIAIGIYAPIKPIWPRRWAPIGRRAHVLVANRTCSACRSGGPCECMRSIQATNVADILGMNLG
jgi:ADP-heptose:LPS heptosyltransferase